MKKMIHLLMIALVLFGSIFMVSIGMHNSITYAAGGTMSQIKYGGLHLESADGGKTWYYEKDGKKYVGWLNYTPQIPGASVGVITFYFNKNGIMQTGMQSIQYNGTTYWFYFNDEGELQTGRQYVGSKKNYYYFSTGTSDVSKLPKGAMVTNMTINGYTYGATGEESIAGPKKIIKTLLDGKLAFTSIDDGKTWYYEKDGKKYVGWLNYTPQIPGAAVKTETFYFNSNGVLQTGLQNLQYNGTKYWFYFDKEGKMQTGRQYVESKKNYYYFSTGTSDVSKLPKGAMVTNMTINGYTYGATGEESIAGPKRIIKTLLDGKLAFTSIDDGKTWYYEKDGKKYVGWLNYTPQIPGAAVKTETFYFNSNGILQTGLQNLQYNGTKYWFYFDKEGKMQTGRQYVESKKDYYYFSTGTSDVSKLPKGAMVTNMTINGYTYGATGNETKETSDDKDITNPEITKEYTINVEAYKGGKITPKDASVAEGESITFRITPDDGYDIEEVWIDGESIGNVSKYTFKNVKKNHTIEADFISIKELNNTKISNFRDIQSSDWYYESVKYAVENNIFNGVSEVSFGPNMNMTRGMLVTVLYRMEGENSTTRSSFDDVTNDAYYSNAIGWAAKKGIVNGIGNNLFAPDKEISRQDLATIMVRYINIKKLKISTQKTNGEEYADSIQIADYAYDNVLLLKQTGLMTGKNQNRFDPYGMATRAEVATLIKRFADKTK